MPEVRPANPDAGKALPPGVPRSVTARTLVAARSSARPCGGIPHGVVEAVDPDSVQLEPLSYA